LLLLQWGDTFCAHSVLWYPASLGKILIKSQRYWNTETRKGYKLEMRITRYSDQVVDHKDTVIVVIVSGSACGTTRFAR